MSKASCLVTEIEDLQEITPEQIEKMEKESGLKIFEYCIAKLQEKGLYRGQQGLGFMDKHASNLFSATIHKKKIAAAKVWFDLIKNDLPEDGLKNLNKTAIELGFSDVEDMLQHFHPLALPLLATLSDEGTYFEEHAVGIDTLLEKHFRDDLKKPVLAFENEFDRAKATFEIEINPEIAKLPSNGTFSLLDLDKVKKMLLSFNEQMNEETEKLKSINTLIESCNESAKASMSANIKYLESSINLIQLEINIKSMMIEQNKKGFEFNELLISHNQAMSNIKLALKQTNTSLNDNGAAGYHNELLKIQSSLAGLEIEQENLKRELEEKTAALAKAKENLNNFTPRGAYDEEYLSGEISAYLINHGSDPHTTLAVRNMNWLPKIRDFLNTENGLVSCVVGVGHLYGKFGLLNQLSGYKISRWSLQSHSFEGEK